MKNFLKICFVLTIGFSVCQSVQPVYSCITKSNHLSEESVLKTRAITSKPRVIKLYDPINISMVKYDVKSFVFTSNADAYYAVETFGEHFTQLRVELPNGFVIFDSGAEKNDNNAKILFKGGKNETYKIHVKLVKTSNNAFTGKFDLLVRQQEFNTFTFSPITPETYHGDLDTTNKDLIPYQLFRKKMYYRNFINKRYIGSECDEINSLFNTEYVLFGGHGTPDGIEFAYNTVMETKYTNFSMKQARLVFLDSCQCAGTSTKNEYNFAQALINRGAKCVIAFEKTVYEQSSTEFGGYFYTKYAEGASVNESVKYAKEKMSKRPELQSVKVYGNGQLTINTPTLSNGYFSIPNLDMPIPIPGPGSIGYK